MIEQVAESDIVITTALIPGLPAPKVIPQEGVLKMKKGSVIVDLAAKNGGNTDLTVPNERIVTPNGVVILGYTDLVNRMAG